MGHGSVETLRAGRVCDGAGTRAVPRDAVGRGRRLRICTRSAVNLRANEISDFPEEGVLCAVGIVALKIGPSHNDAVRSARRRVELDDHLCEACVCCTGECTRKRDDLSFARCRRSGSSHRAASTAKFGTERAKQCHQLRERATVGHNGVIAGYDYAGTWKDALYFRQETSHLVHDGVGKPLNGCRAVVRFQDFDDADVIDAAIHEHEIYSTRIDTTLPQVADGEVHL